MTARLGAVCGVIGMAVVGLVQCGGGSPTAPPGPTLPHITVVVRSEGVDQAPIDGEYRLPRDKAGSVHWFVVLPDISRTFIKVEFGYETCRDRRWSYTYEGQGYTGNYYYQFLLEDDALEYTRRSWQSWPPAPDDWKPTRLWPEPDVCVFDGHLTVTAPEYPTPVSANAVAIVRFH